MSEEDKDSKTEEASERKLNKAKADGDVWSSREAGHTLGFLALVTLVALVIPYFGAKGLMGISAIFDLAGSVRVETAADLRAITDGFANTVAGVFLPLLGVMFACGLFSILIAGPFVVSLKRIQPKPSKLNPLSGFKRIYSVSNLIEFAKSLVKLLAIAILMMIVLKRAITEMLPGTLMLPQAMLKHIGSYALLGLAWVLAMMLPVLVFDIFWKRREWLKKHRMSKKDQRDEHKDSDGDPMVRARRREISMRRLRQQVRKSVPEATLVVMNPTHYAVALRYERGKDAAPVCVAKGADLLALKIRDLALEHDVTVLESPPLARALFKVSEVDQPIPEDHWAAVAELVGYVLDMRKRIKRKLPDGTRQLN